jgi:hypothetical protein
MSIEKIIKDHLTTNKCDGLIHADQCYCMIDKLAPCGSSEYLLSCQPAVKIECSKCDKISACEVGKDFINTDDGFCMTLKS